MIKRSISLFLICVLCMSLTGCGGDTPLAKQAEIMTKELSKKPADLYEENFEKNGIWAHVRKLKDKELKEYYDRAGTGLYDVYFVSITNKSDKNVILSVPDTSITTNTGEKIIIGNELKKLMKKGDDGTGAKISKGIGVTFLGIVSWGLFIPAYLAAGEPNPKQKTKEIYYQTTYDKGLQSIVLPPYYTTAGLLVMPDKSYKLVNFKFQETKELKYFELEYPMELTTDKLRKEREKTALKDAEKQRKEQIKLMNQNR